LVFVSGATDGASFRGQPYTGQNGNGWLSCYSLPNFDHQWTRSHFSSYTYGGPLVADGLGGVYQWSFYLYDGYCGRYDLNCIASNDNSYNWWVNYLRKYDINGNLIANIITTGLPQTVTLDSNGTLVSVGQFYGGTIRGITNLGQGDIFIKKQTIVYNCSCTDLTNLISDVEQLLNIAPDFTS